MVNGRLFTVASRAEEREILEQYAQQERQQLETAEPEHRETIRRSIRRVERRLEKVTARSSEEARLESLRDEDEEILLLLIL